MPPLWYSAERGFAAIESGGTAAALLDHFICSAGLTKPR